MRSLTEQEIKELQALSAFDLVEREAIALDRPVPVRLGAPLPLIHQVLSE